MNDCFLEEEFGLLLFDEELVGGIFGCFWFVVFFILCFDVEGIWDGLLMEDGDIGELEFWKLGCWIGGCNCFFDDLGGIDGGGDGFFLFVFMFDVLGDFVFICFINLGIWLIFLCFFWN